MLLYYLYLLYLLYLDAPVALDEHLLERLGADFDERLLVLRALLLLALALLALLALLY